MKFLLQTDLIEQPSASISSKLGNIFEVFSGKNFIFLLLLRSSPCMVSSCVDDMCARGVLMCVLLVIMHDFKSPVTKKSHERISTVSQEGPAAKVEFTLASTAMTSRDAIVLKKMGYSLITICCGLVAFRTIRSIDSL